MRKIPHYSYRVFWSTEDGEYVAECDEIPGLSGLAPSETQAIKELKVAIGVWLDHLSSTGESLPMPHASAHTAVRETAKRKRANVATKKHPRKAPKRAAVKS
jgi:predicted RNase H-like HicB family nuclease